MFTPPRIIRFICIGLAAILSSSAWAQKAEAPLMEVGDKWTYKFTNTGDRRDPYTFFNQVTHVDAQSAWIYGETQDPQSRRPKYAWRYDLKRSGFMESFAINLKNADKLGGRGANNMPNDDTLKFPLEVGKEWNVKEAWGNGQGYTEYKAKVESFDKIKVEAGEFDVFKVTLKGYWTRTADGAGSGRAEWAIWYSPQIKRDVKRMYEDRNQGGSRWNQSETELVKWEPKAALGDNPVVGLKAESSPASTPSIPAVSATR